MKRSTHRQEVGRVSMILGAVVLGIGLSGPVSADPPGNNGTIKVDGVEFDTHPDNQPHVGCSFQIDFYGYEAGVPVSLTFEVQPPTGDAVVYTEDGTLDDDDATGGGSEEGLDGQFSIDLADVLADYEPQPNQGFHVKLTITVDDGDTVGGQVKHKVFWVTECEGSTTTTTGPTTTTTGSTTTTTGSTTTTTGSTTTTEGTTTTESTTTTTEATTTTDGTTTTTAAGATTTGTPPASVQPTILERPSDGTEVLGVQLARTGNSRTLVTVGGLLLAFGILAELIARRTQRQHLTG